MDGRCPHCERNSGVRVLTCIGCCLRLLRSAPAGEPRRAMYAHLRAYCTDEQLQNVVAAAQREGLTK